MLFKIVTKRYRVFYDYVQSGPRDKKRKKR